MRLTVDGLGLHVEDVGAGSPLLLLHGFTGGAATWEPLALHAAGGLRTLAVDLIGHGRSDAPADPARYGMEQCVMDLVALLDQLEIERTDVLGYSLGGRVALHLAAAAPRRMRALVLESASPGLDDPAERQARQAADRALAEDIQRDGVAAFVARWERLPLFASQAALPEEVKARQRDQRLANSPRGLANSLLGMGAGAQEPLWARLPELDMPALILVGALDAKYRAFGQRMAARLPAARLIVVPDAGHAVHLEQPDAFCAAVLGFLATSVRDHAERGAASAPSATH